MRLASLVSKGRSYVLERTFDIQAASFVFEANALTNGQHSMFMINVQLAERTVLALLNRTSATKSERKINPVQMIGIRKVRHAIVKNTIPKIIVCISTIPFNSPASGFLFHKK